MTSQYRLFEGILPTVCPCHNIFSDDTRVAIAGIIKLAIFLGNQTMQIMVILRDLPLMVHCLGWHYTSV